MVSLQIYQWFFFFPPILSLFLFKKVSENNLKISGLNCFHRTALCVHLVPSSVSGRGIPSDFSFWCEPAVVLVLCPFKIINEAGNSVSCRCSASFLESANYRKFFILCSVKTRAGPQFSKCYLIILGFLKTGISSAQFHFSPFLLSLLSPK